MLRILLLSIALVLNGCSYFSSSNNTNKDDSSALLYEDFFQEDFFEIEDNAPTHADVRNGMVDPNIAEMEYVEAMSSPEISLNAAQQKVNHESSALSEKVNSKTNSHDLHSSYQPKGTQPISMPAPSTLMNDIVEYDLNGYADLGGMDAQFYNMYFKVKPTESLKIKLNHFLSSNGYKLIWDTDFDVFFENDMEYNGDDIFAILKSLSNDISETGVDIHINVYMGNNVVLVYSVRS